MEAFKFVKVEEFFKDYPIWNTVDAVVSHTYNKKARQLALSCRTSEGTTALVLLHFPRKDTVRLRFHPGKSVPEEFLMQNTRSIVMDRFEELHALHDATQPFTIDSTGDADHVEILTRTTKPFMKVVVSFAPFQIEVFKFNAQGIPFPVLSDAIPGIYYTKREIDGYDEEEYSIIQANVKPGTAKYIGFGEKGGPNLCKNSTQLTYFNFDNMRYRQIYNRGALDDREPLYHSDPFFLEFYGNPAENSVYGLFIDNASETFVDVGFLNSNRYLFGSLFGELDYYVFLGDSCADIMDAYTSFVGHTRLKPRYVLGYHQGCYGYDTREKLETAARRYREHRIPIDGLHIDVDIQHNYQTFTIDEGKFPNPKEMFSSLKQQGFKCSTNITPIISDRDRNYSTYTTGKAKGYFVADERCKPLNDDGEHYQNYNTGWESSHFFDDPNYNSGKPYVGEVYYGGDRGTTGHYPDLGRKEVRYWWGEQYNYLFETGLEMVWQDMTSPAIRDTRGDMRSFPFKLLVTDNFIKKYYGESEAGEETPEETTYPKSPAVKIRNLYSYNLHKATYHGLNHLACRKNKRNFIIGRGGFTGMHRFAGLWTGDNASEWYFLHINVAQVLGLGISGQSICGEDIGGFEAEQPWQHWADPELLIRWTLAGAFLPWFRNHYIAKGVKYFQEPYAFQDVINQVPWEDRYLYESVLPTCRYYIELRYRLMQLFYDAMFENTLNGMPITRAMFLNDGHDTALFNDKLAFLNNQFFVRDDLLIAPVLEKQSHENAYGKRDVYLPAGSDWYCFMDNKKPLGEAIEGGTTILDYDAHISHDDGHIGFLLPIYIRAGAIIPTLEPEQYVGEFHAQNKLNPLTLNIYPGTSGTYTMYLDDGVSRSSAPAGDPKYGHDPEAGSEYRETEIHHFYTKPGTRRITIKRLQDNYTPPEPYFFVAILHAPNEADGESGPLAKVKISGRIISGLSGGTPEARAERLNESAGDAWYYNENIHISFLKIFDTRKTLTIQLEYVK